MLGSALVHDKEKRVAEACAGFLRERVRHAGTTDDLDELLRGDGLRTMIIDANFWQSRDPAELSAMLEAMRHPLKVFLLHDLTQSHVNMIRILTYNDVSFVPLFRP